MTKITKIIYADLIYYALCCAIIHAMVFNTGYQVATLKLMNDNNAQK